MESMGKRTYTAILVVYQGGNPNVLRLTSCGSVIVVVSLGWGSGIGTLDRSPQGSVIALRSKSSTVTLSENLTLGNA